MLAMSRWLLRLVFVVVMALVQSGCERLLADLAARSPAASGRHDPLAARVPEDQRQAMADLDRIIAKHPDAANTVKLQRMRNELKEQSPAVDSNGTMVYDSDYDDVTDPYDRRHEDWSDDGRRIHIHVTDGARMMGTRSLTNRLRLENETHPDERIRTREPFRFTTPPSRVLDGSDDGSDHIIVLDSLHFDQRGR
jgi:hypothetical protein